MNTKLPMPPEVKVTDPYHLKVVYEYLGMCRLLDKLEKLAIDFPKIPGVSMALATVQAQVAEHKTKMLARHLKLAIANGFDPDLQTLSVGVRDSEVFLQPGAPDEEAQP